MEWLIAVLVIAVLGLAAVISSGGLGEMSKDPVRDVYHQDLPATPLTGEDIETLQFGIVLRGYAMGQVDDVLARLGAEIADRDAVIAELRDQLDSTDASAESGLSETQRDEPDEVQASVGPSAGSDVR